MTTTAQPSVTETVTVTPAPTGRGRRGARFSLRPLSLLTAVVALAFALLLTYPLVRLILEVFVDDGGLTAEPFREAFALPGIWGTIRNTLLIVVGATVLATLLACLFAWLNERTDARLGFVADVMPITPLLVPAIAGTVGWVFLLAPRSGILNVLLRDLLGAVGIDIGDEGPINLFTVWGLVFLYTLVLLPYVYLPIAAAMVRLDPALEEASRVAGVGPFRSFLKVVVPAIKPAIAGGMLVAVVMGLATFSVPIIVGTSARIDVLSVRIYTLLTFSFPPSTEPAVALSVVLLVFVLLGSLLQRRVVKSGAHATIGGKGTRGDVVRLGRFKPVARTLMVLFVAVASVLPLLGLFYISLRPFWTASLDFQNLSFANYQEVLINREVTSAALQNSVMLGAAGAILGMLAATLLALYVGGGSRGGKFVDGLAKAPGAFSHIVLAVAFLAAFAGPPFRIGGTLLLLFMAYILFNMPQGYLTAFSSYTQLSRELSEASAISGAGPGRTLRRILLPLMLPGLVGGAAVLFVLGIGEVTASALLAGTQTPVIGFVIVDLWAGGTFPQIAALGAIMTVVTATVTCLLLYFGKSRARG
jgi:iron(III) transport system permease protein